MATFSQGYTNLTRLYGTTNLIANRFAFMATTFEDKPSAQEASLQSLLWIRTSGTAKTFSTTLATGPILPSSIGFADALRAPPVFDQSPKVAQGTHLPD